MHRDAAVRHGNDGGRALLAPSSVDGFGTDALVRSRIPGTSPWALAAPRIVAGLASHADPVLVSAPPGGGKEMVARLVHEASSRAGRPFVVLPAHGFSEPVLRSVLFEAPATLPSSIRSLRREYAERAVGGTIYVADLAELSGRATGYVAEFVSGRSSDHARRRLLAECDVRIIFGTSADVPRSANERAVVRIPALVERPGDIAPLAELFVASLCSRLGREARALDARAVEALEQHPWPGNVGELKRVVEAAVRRAGPPSIGLALLPSQITRDISVDDPADVVASGIVLHEEVERFERRLLAAALARCAGVQTRAAQLLGMKVSTLNSKLSAHRIDAAAFKPVRR